MNTEFHKGAVCYIDLLGFSYLTNLLENKEIYNDESKEKSFAEKTVKELTLSDFRLLNDYLKFNNNENDLLDTSKTKSQSISEWAYNIVDSNLKKFHEIVEKNCATYQNVEYTAISDSMFIVSENSDEILFILANVFRESIKSGILLRAGLAYGTYYSVKTHISSFNVYGTAVTDAVTYEQYGKGCRIFTDSDFPSTCKSFCNENSSLFCSYKNYKDYSTLDCFEWMMMKDDYVLSASDFFDFNLSQNHEKTINLLCDNLEVYSNLRFSPKFNWNSKTSQGAEQLGASIEYISNLIDKIYRLFKNINLENLNEGLKDGIYFANSKKRSEQLLTEVIKIKKKEIINVLNI